MPRPNIVVVMADQLAPQFTGAYGHPLVRTPHMDALAADGARFDAAYCNSPLCAPSRAAFMSGRHVSRIGAYDNAAEFPASVPSFAHYLRALGYRTCLSGKMHFIGPDQLHGFEERLTTDVYPADHAWTPDWDHPDVRIDKWYHNMDAVAQAGVAATTFQYEYDEEATFLARRRIMGFAMDRDEPFALVVSLIHPHDPYVTRPEFWDLYDPAEIDLPATGPADDAQTARVRAAIEADRADLADADIRAARHAYYGNVSYVDAKLGQIVQALKEADLFDNTILVVTSDHGDMLGERGLWYKMTFFEHAARVPLILHGPGVAAGRVDAPVSLIDLLPTFVEIAGGDPDALGAPCDGRSLWPLARGAAQDDRVAVAEYCAECTGQPMLMLRRGTWKYMACPGDPPQLYDLSRDPWERDNRAGDPSEASRLDALEAEAAAHWDPAAVRADVLASQHRRRLVHAALERGAWTSWDYRPPRDAAREFVRNTVSWDDVLHRMQHPSPARRP